MGVCTYSGMYGKKRPIAIRWYQLDISGGSVLKITRGGNHPLGKPCYGKRLSLASFNRLTIRNLFQNGANDMSKMLNMVNDFLSKSSKLLCSSNHPILFKFHQLMENIFIKELQIVF